MTFGIQILQIWIQSGLYSIYSSAFGAFQCHTSIEFMRHGGWLQSIDRWNIWSEYFRFDVNQRGEECRHSELSSRLELFHALTSQLPRAAWDIKIWNPQFVLNSVSKSNGNFSSVTTFALSAGIAWNMNFCPHKSKSGKFISIDGSGMCCHLSY